MFSSTKKYIFRQHNPYNLNDTTIESTSEISLSKKKVLTTKKISQAKISQQVTVESFQRSLLVNSEINSITEIMSNFHITFQRMLLVEKQKQLALKENEKHIKILNEKIKKLIQKESDQRQQVISEAYTQKKEINNTALNALLKIKKNESRKLETINKKFKDNLNSLIVQEEKNRNIIIQEEAKNKLEENSNAMFLDLIKNKISVTINSFDALKKQLKNNNKFDELEVYLKYLIQSLNEFKKIHLKYKNLSTIEFKHIQLLQEIQWKISKFGEIILNTLKENNIDFAYASNLSFISKSIDEILNKIFAHHKIGKNKADKVLANLTALNWLDNLRFIYSEGNKIKPKDYYSDFIILEIIKQELSSLDIKQFAALIDSFKENIFKCLEIMQMYARKLAEDYTNIPKLTNEKFWISYLQDGFDIISMYKDNVDQFLANYLLQSCLDGNLIAFKAYYEKIVENNLNISITDQDGQTVFHKACLSGNIELIKTLLEINPEFINAEDNNGVTPAWICSESGDANVAHVLLKNGADFRKNLAQKKASPVVNALQKGFSHIWMMTVAIELEGENESIESCISLLRKNTPH